MLKKAMQNNSDLNQQILAEYNALRKEIDTLSQQRNQYRLYNLAVLGATGKYEQNHPKI
ncbi:hypothetical protein JXA02_14125 [candidate division KSB1 bacterium]|nr:hypothetical protein [candidate division KSB1 bacterium]